MSPDVIWTKIVWRRPLTSKHLPCFSSISPGQSEEDRDDAVSDSELQLQDCTDIETEIED